MSIWPTWKNQPAFAVFVLILVVLIGAYFAVMTMNAYKEGMQIGQAEPTEHFITVQGEGTVEVKPDLATVRLGVRTESDTVEQAQDTNTETMNNLEARIQDELEIKDADLETTNYSLRENRIWNPETREYENRGWIINQTLVVKVRNVDRVGELLNIAGSSGITDISGPHFTIDETKDYTEEARLAAIEDAKEQAEKLASALGVHLDDIVGFSEGYSPTPYYDYYGDFALEAGLSADDGAQRIVPEIQPGSEEVRTEVSVTFRIKN